MTNYPWDMLERENLIRIPHMGDYPPEQAAQVAKDCSLRMLDEPTITRVAHEYGCSRRQAIGMIEQQMSPLALHDLLLELATERRGEG